MSRNTKLPQRVVAAAEEALARQKYVAPAELFNALGWLPAPMLDKWRQGRIAHLQAGLQVPPDKVVQAVELLREWALAKGLTAGEVDYVAANRDRSALRFTATGDPAQERVFRTHWVAAGLSEARLKQVTAKQNKVPDLLVVMAVQTWSCVECGGTGDLLMKEESGSLCLTCADMDHLVFLPAGDATLTRRAKKASTLSAVVGRWNRSRKRYDRQGILVEEPALVLAEEQCFADEEVRLRRRGRDAERRADQDVQLAADMAAKIVEMFPGCPEPRAQAIADHTALRGSGRVGRSAAGRSLDEGALRRAVIASIRHEDTPYDSLLMAGVPRDRAREQIRTGIDRVLAAWQAKA